MNDNVKKLKLCIVGQDVLYKATLEACKKHFEILNFNNCDILWFCYDTPIEGDKKSYPEQVIEWIEAFLSKEQADDKHPLVLISSQLPVGTIAKLEKEFPQHSFAYQPENVRVATALQDFENQARVIVGRRTDKHDNIIFQLFAPFTNNVILTDPETAEMVKHALNCYLGMNIAWINEIKRIAESVGANPNAISMALLSVNRISPKAPLKPGNPFSGGHLSRDIRILNELCKKYNIDAPIISNIIKSNSILS